MKIVLKEKPNTMIEAATLMIKAHEYKGGRYPLIKNEDILLELSEEKQKYFEDYRLYMESILSEAKEVIEENESLVKFFKLKSNLNNDGFLNQIVITNNAKSLDELDLENFKVGALYGIYTFDNLLEDDIYKTNKDNIRENTEEMIKLDNIYKLVDKFDIEMEVKLLFLEFFSNIEDIYKEYMKVIRDCEEIYIRHYPKVEKYVENFLKRNRKEDGGDLKYEDYFISKLLDFKELMDKTTMDLHLYTSTIVYNGASLMIPSDDQFQPILIEGVLLKEILEFSELDKFKNDDLEKRLIAMGDSTRFKIIELLGEKQYYVKEIADTLELSPSTISHHLDILLQNGLLTIKIQGRKAYYHINKESMMDIAKFFKKLGGELDGEA